MTPPTPEAEKLAEKVIKILGERGYWAYHDKSQIDEHIQKIASLIAFLISGALEEAKRDAIVEFCEGEDSKLAEIERQAVAKERERAARILDHYGSVRVTAEMIAKKIRSGEAAEQ